MAASPLSIAAIMAVLPGKTIQEIKHPHIRGLMLRIHPGGRRTWSLRYALHGRDARIKLGEWPAVVLAQVEAKALEILSLVSRGQDPAAQLADAKARRQTLAEFAPDFLERHGEHLKPRTRSDYAARMKRNILPKLGRLSLGDLGLGQISAWHHSMRAIPFTGNRALAVLSVALGCAIRWGLRPGPNPCEGIQRFKEPRRHRYLTLAELQQVGAALDAAKGDYPPPVLAAIALQLLTGMRPGEVLGIEWEHVDLQAGTLQLPHHKTEARGERVVILPPEAVAILKKLPAHQGSPLVFAGQGKTGTLGSSVSHAWQAIRVVAGVRDVRLHDLRHTYASHGISRGLTLAQVGHLLGHSTPQTTSRYAHLVDATSRTHAGTIAGTIGGAMRKKRKKKGP